MKTTTQKNPKLQQAAAVDPFRSHAKFLSPWIILASILGLGFLAYANSFRAEFHFDDNTSILNVESISGYMNIPLLWNQIPKSRFLTYLTFAWNYRTSGIDSFSYHVVNWTIHFLASFGVFFLIKALLRQENVLSSEAAKRRELWLAWAGALFFLLHPVQTQAVSYVVQRLASLAALFYIWAVFFYVLARQGRRWAYWLFGLSAAFAFFSKQSAFSLPGALLIYEICFAKDRKQIQRAVLTILLPGFIMVAAVLVFEGVRSWDKVLNILAQSELLSPAQYFRAQPSALLHYLRLVILPYGQNLDYTWLIPKHFFHWRFYLPCIPLAGFAVLGFLFLKKGYRALAFGIFWFFVAMSVESSIIAIDDVIFEHRLYLPMAGLALLFALLYEKIVKKIGYALPILMGISLLLAGLTYRRNEVWKTEEALWKDVVKKTPKKTRGYRNLAREYTRKHRVDDAIAVYKQILTVHPDRVDPDALYNLGVMYQEKGDWQEAINYFQKVLETRPKADQPHLGIGLSYKKMGDFAKAEEYYKKALELDPNESKTYEALAAVYLATKQYEKAIPFVRQAVEYHLSIKEKTGGTFAFQQLVPLTAQLGELCFREGKYEESVAFFDLVTTMQPSEENAYYFKARAYSALGNPKMVMAQVNILQRMGRTEALEDLRKALKQV